MHYFNIFLGVIAFTLVNETLQWGWIIARHAQWMHKNQHKVSCKNMNFCMTFLAGVMTSLLTMGIGGYLIISLARHWSSFQYDSIMTIGVMLALIHHFAILARCTELPVELWPVPSRFISRKLVMPSIRRYMSLKRNRRKDDK